MFILDDLVILLVKTGGAAYGVWKFFTDDKNAPTIWLLKKMLLKEKKKNGEVDFLDDD